MSDAWIDSARQHIVEKECDCDCHICARGDHTAEDCPHDLSYTGTCQSCGRYLDVRQHKRCPEPCGGYIG